MDEAKLARMQAAGAQRRLGGKGSMRRKKKVVRKNQAASNDMKIQQTVRKFGGNPIDRASEVAFYKEDDTVQVFKNARLTAAVNANTFLVSGNSEVVKGEDYQASQLTPEQIQQILSQAGGLKDLGVNDDDMPELVDSELNFEETANEEDDMPALVDA
eukprot:TRINITY_DN6956_c0_g1_i1.p1 TRINITY_DN6956_c0_g1~~TRINITY_DN6956_c0_g1_i1.p1  ORF type:complete len:178 (+),score=51.21 TRINITY_DN6956_c0_g1_i1:61-534(+)